MKSILTKAVFAICVASFFIISCDTEPSKDIPDVSAVDGSFELVRFEKKLLSTKGKGVDGLLQLQAQHPAFYDLYFNNILPLEGDTPETLSTNVQAFLEDERMSHLIDTTFQVHSNFEEDIVPELEDAFQFVKYYFPLYKVPNIYTFISEFAYQRFIFEDQDRDGIGIGLDMYLGGNYPYKRIDPTNSAFSQYLTRSFNQEHIVRNTMQTVVEDLAGEAPGNRLLDIMIHNGKKLYLLEQFLPTYPDSVVLNYSAEQTEWVKDNELEMWAFFFDKELFYESNRMNINKYINDSPDSPGMPPAAPGRTANYMGLQIVKKYMQKFPETTLHDLLAIRDAQKILDQSRYKPKRQ